MVTRDSCRNCSMPSALCNCLPPVVVARGGEGSCEACALPVRPHERIHVFGENWCMHISCPKDARA